MRALLERELERSLEPTERSAAATLCSAIEGEPLRILQSAAVDREQEIPLDQSARIIAQTPVVNLMASTDEKQRLRCWRGGVAGVLLQARHVCAIAEVRGSSRR